jgi:hypothetical protein
VCPECLVELVADPAATVRCRHCGKVWPATMQSCPSCLAELHPDPAAALEAMGRILAFGGHLYRPDGVARFAGGPGCTLLRLAARGPMVFTGDSGLVEASVAGSDGRAMPPLSCHDGDDLLFRLLAYEAAARAVVAVGTDGAALATYLRTGTGIDVRDETSAPVAKLVRRRGLVTQQNQYELVETGGRVLGTLGSTEAELDGWIDDQWWFRPSNGDLPLRQLAVVALVLAAKVLLGRPAPVRMRREVEPEDDEPWPVG